MRVLLRLLGKAHQDALADLEAHAARARHRLEADDEVRIVVGLVEGHESHALIGDQLGEVILQRGRVSLPVAQRDRVLFRVEGLPGSGRTIEDDIGGFVHRG